MRKAAWAVLAMGMLATLAWAGDMGPENAKRLRERALSSTASEQAAGNTVNSMGTSPDTTQPLPANQSPSIQAPEPPPGSQEQNPGMEPQQTPSFPGGEHH